MSFIICHSLGKLEDQPWYKYVKDWVVYTQFDYSGLKNQALKLPLHSTDKGIVYDNILFCFSSQLPPIYPFLATGPTH